MPFNLDSFSKQFGTTSLQGTGNTAWNSGVAATTPAKQGFPSQVGQTLAHAPAAIGSALYHGVVDPFAHLIQNNVNAAQQGSNADSINSRRQSLDQASQALSKAYSGKQITKDQFLTESKKQMAQYQALQDEASQNVNSVKSTAQMLPDALSAAGTVATLGAGGVELAGAKAAAEAAGARIAGSVGSKVAGKAVQAVGDTIGAGRTGNVASQAVKGIVKNALVTQPTVQFAGQTAGDIAHGNLPGLATDAALAAAPGAVGLVAKGVKAVAPALKEAAFGRSSVLTGALGNRVVDFVKNNPQLSPVLKQMEQFTLNQPAVKGDAKKGGEFLAQHLKGIGVDPKTADLNKVVSQFQAYAKNVGKLDNLKASGAAHTSAVVSHDFTQTIPKVAAALNGLDNASTAERVAATNKALDAAGITNVTVRDAINNGVHSGASVDDIKALLADQKQIIPGVKLGKGFIATYGPKEQAKLPSLAEAKAAGAPDLGKAANPVLGSITGGLAKAGLGLQATAPATTRGAVIASLDKRLAGTQFESHGKDILNSLNTAMSKTRGVFDPRLLRPTRAGLVPGAVNIEQELGVSPKDAKTILKAVKGAYGDVPLGIRSLGEKITDKTLQHFPPMATFLKAQGYGKYTANPFFWTKQATKGEFIAQAETGGKALNAGRLLNTMLGTAPKDSTMSALRSEGYLSKGGSAGGEADFFGNLAPNVSNKVTAPEVSGYIQQSMGQAAEQFAKNNGTTVGDILKTSEDGAEHPLKGELDNLMQMVVGYPKGDHALNSNLAKSLNVLVFPSRFEAKVAMATATYFAKQPKVVQLALVNNALKANAWTSSPQGKQWQKDNADTVGLFNYFSPTHSVEAVMSALHSGNVGDLGQVGGMPFGVITTLLKNQGVKLPGQVTGNDVNPATGENYIQKLPTSTKARLQQGITDLIGQMFSYPGATVGLPSKTSEVQSFPGLKINAKEQKVVGGSQANQPAPTQSGALAPLTPGRNTLKPFTGKATVSPIYKKSSRPPKTKTLAKLPGTF